MILTTTIKPGLELAVEYNQSTNTVEELYHCKLGGHDITHLIHAHFETDLNKIIDGVDWREKARTELTEA